MTTQTSADIVGAFAQDVARAFAEVSGELPDLWGLQVGVVFGTDADAAVTPERVWLFPVAADGAASPAPEDAAPAAPDEAADALLAGLDTRVSALVAALYTDLEAAGGRLPTGLRLQVDAEDGATDLDFSYGPLDVVALDAADVGAWLDELYGEA